MKFKANVQRKEAEVRGFKVQVPFGIYKAGTHELTDAEAGVLNDSAARAFTNRLSSVLKKLGHGVEGMTPTPVAADVVQSDLDKIAREFEFGVSAPRTRDPVRSMAKSIAAQMLRTAARQKGVKLGKDEMRKRVSDLLANPKYSWIQDEAARRVSRLREVPATVDLD